MNKLLSRYDVNSIWLKLTVSILVSCLPVVASAAPSCEQLFAPQKIEHMGTDLRSEDFERMFLRKPTENIDPVYVANMKRVAHAFESQILSPEPIADFRGFLKEQHKLAVMGEAPGTFYWPEVNKRRDGMIIPSSIVNAQLNAGRYRNEMEAGQAQDSYLTHEVPVAVEIRVEIVARTENQKTERISLGPVPFTFKFPKIDGIPAAASPRYSTLFSVDKIRFDYPAAKYVQVYVAEMAKSLEAIHKNLRSESPDRAAALKDLARYYQLAMIGHPFSRVNNSLVMAQVNVVLRKLRMNTVMHGDLDYLVRSLDSHQAEQAFVDYVLKNQ